MASLWASIAARTASATTSGSDSATRARRSSACRLSRSSASIACWWVMLAIRVCSSSRTPSKASSNHLNTSRRGSAAAAPASRTGLALAPARAPARWPAPLPPSPRTAAGPMAATAAPPRTPLALSVRAVGGT